MDERLGLIQAIIRKKEMFDYSEMPDISLLLESKSPEEVKDIVIVSLLKTISRNLRSPQLSENMLALIGELRTSGMDYPELAGIEKSMKAG